MLRLHFTSEDLSRVRFARGPDPLWETVLSIQALSGPRGRAVFAPWRAQVRSKLVPLPHWQLRMLRYLTPVVGDFPDFLTPPQASQGMEAGIETILATPGSRLRRELAPLPGAPSWARLLADGDPETLTRLGQALRAYHHAAVAPHYPRMQALIDAERAGRARTVLDHGAQGLLAGLGPAMRWRPPVLEVDYPMRRDIHLAGRGLVLMPSAFCWYMPVTLVDPDLPPVLVYPLPRRPDWWTGPAETTGPQALSNLLGSTRAACLNVIEDGCTTGELARRTATTPPTTSQHATTLREAGLIASTRRANTVLHTLTPLGTALLRATVPTPGRSRG